MPLLFLIILAVVQGLTEFLPISSSGHLVLVHHFAVDEGVSQAWSDDLMLDVAVHVGTLLSVLVYFRRDVLDLIAVGLKCFSFKNNQKLKQASLAPRHVVFIIVASLPVIFAGFLLFFFKPEYLRSIEVVAWMTIIFGVVLGFADKMTVQSKTFEMMTLKDSVLIGLAQMLALVPGTSRSGITMTAGRFLGMTRVDSARFSLLIGIVAIAGAGALSVKDLIENGSFDLGVHALIAAFISFLCGWGSIAIMMRWLDKHGFMPFVVYRIVLGGTILGLIYSGVL